MFCSKQTVRLFVEEQDCFALYVKEQRIQKGKTVLRKKKKLYDLHHFDH